MQKIKGILCLAMIDANKLIHSDKTNLRRFAMQLCFAGDVRRCRPPRSGGRQCGAERTPLKRFADSPLRYRTTKRLNGQFLILSVEQSLTDKIKNRCSAPHYTLQRINSGGELNAKRKEIRIRRY